MSFMKLWYLIIYKNMIAKSEFKIDLKILESKL